MGAEGDNARPPRLNHLQGDPLVQPQFTQAIDLVGITTDIGHTGGVAANEQRKRNDFRHDGNRQGGQGTRQVGLRLILNSRRILST